MTVTYLVQPVDNGGAVSTGLARRARSLAPPPHGSRGESREGSRLAQRLG
eukprot:CAMPEP_0115881932 /NCGR_PEP_ID=MMETSP0287-20121206/28721_1 /TAXON_ID=412157 /ORGANISM="Chrysochromulina rotalis, Strain UIO044" /LENGTH=49 /DNA_ID= /DNA_START= /DNA_END= /DNA_ORIENTATION=